LPHAIDQFQEMYVYIPLKWCLLSLNFILESRS
jgi:hypothetical protein